MVPDDSLTIRERAIASWPPAWHGQNLRDILVTLGYDVDRPWRELPKKDRDWILYTDEPPTVPVYAGYTPAETRRALKRKEEPSYMGTFTGARRYVLETFARTESAQMKKRVSRYMVSTECPECHGKRLRPEALKVKFAGLDIADMSRRPLKRLAEIFAPYAAETAPGYKRLEEEHPEKAMVACRIAKDLVGRLEVLMELGLGYLSLKRSTPTLSPASCSVSGSAPRSTATSSVWSTCWTSRRRACTRRTPRRCSGRSTGSRRRATRSSSSSTSSTSCATPTGSWTWGRMLASTAARCSTAVRWKASAR